VLVAGPPAHVAGHCRIISTACRAMAPAEYAQLGNPEGGNRSPIRRW
jgi:hypothetical protein